MRQKKRLSSLQDWQDGVIAIVRGLAFPAGGFRPPGLLDTEVGELNLRKQKTPQYQSFDSPT
jgi:hypothetical protein